MGLGQSRATARGRLSCSSFSILFLAGSRVVLQFFFQVLSTPWPEEPALFDLWGRGHRRLLLRELLNNRELSYAPVGFIDDNPKKQGKVIHGFRVFGGNGMLGKNVGDHQIEQLLISTRRISEERFS